MLSRQARASDRRDEEPTLDTTLAAVLHDRFSAEGRLDDLDEVIARYRRALTRQVPAIVYPAMLSNLGIALQDSYLYRQDGSLLDEAIELHERAVTASAPSSPDRAGYLGALAAAVQLRFERDGQAADLDRVISLGEQALAARGPGAPERAKLLGSLAAARHLRALDTSSPADFDRAISTYRAALRRIRGGSPARPSVLAGYATALGDHPGRHRQADVLHAFLGAVAASDGAPAVRLEVASSMGDWALRNGLWPQAAAACHSAAQARRMLFGTQLSRAHRNTWLARSEGLSAAEALAWARCGQLRRAAVSLDSGRALALSGEVDARSAASRLRAGRHDELAARYEQAVDRLGRLASAAGEPWFPAGRPQPAIAAPPPSGRRQG
jgi:hypothetical protein